MAGYEEPVVHGLLKDRSDRSMDPGEQENIGEQCQDIDDVGEDRLAGGALSDCYIIPLLL